MNSEYFKSQGLDILFSDLVSKLESEQPENAKEYIQQYMMSNTANQDIIDQSDHDAANKPTNRRGAVSAKTITEEEINNFVLRVLPKDEETNQAINKATTTCLLFAYLEDEEKKRLCDAFEPKAFGEGENIITQGDDGDEFYYLHSGAVDVLVNGSKVTTIKQGGTFGELALIYGTPRAATIKATEPCKVLALDSDSYNVIVKGSMMKKRKLYEEFLTKVPILGSLDSWERMTVADALEVCNFQKDDQIVTQGETGDAFYIILEGSVVVTQKVATPSPSADNDNNTNEEIKEVGRLGRSDYFGEIALLTQKPRAATVTACDQLKCLKLDRERFERVLGPCVEILKRNVDKYNSYITLTN